jgi:hypothetical protein
VSSADILQGLCTRSFLSEILDYNNKIDCVLASALRFEAPHAGQSLVNPILASAESCSYLSSPHLESRKSPNAVNGERWYLNPNLRYLEALTPFPVSLLFQFVYSIRLPIACQKGSMFATIFSEFELESTS